MRLPIDDSKEPLLSALRALAPGERLVVSAPTGSGKSTRLPVWCLEAGAGPILVIEPRRVACRTLAHWVADSLRTPLGERVGYLVRFESRATERTEILFVTPGVARRLLADGALGGYGTIVFDEFHERSWECDAVLAVLAAHAASPRLLLMSATLEAQRLAGHYQARLVESHGRSYRVAISYHSEGELTVPSPWRLVPRVCRAVQESWTGQGATLVFLPGLASMRQVAQALRPLPVALLHGTHSSQSQARAFDESQPRVVLATNVAESSLTLPGITTVIDSGLEKRPIHQSGHVALATVPISSASAEQRAGRAGRTAPGQCLRLWDSQARLEARRPPDLERMELDELLLFLAGLPDGLDGPRRWLDAPPAFAWERALQRLQAAELLDRKGRLTPLGRQVAALPLETDWGRLLALAPSHLRPNLCDLYAVSQSRRPLRSAHANAEQQERRLRQLGSDPWRWPLAALHLDDPEPYGLERDSWEEARQLSRELQQLLPSAPTGDRSRPHPELAMFLARHWPERHFVRRPQREAWANGTIECRPARGEPLPDDCQAALFLKLEPVAALGRKVELQARWALPTTLAELRQAGYGVAELTKVRQREGQIVARLHWVYGGRVLAQQELPLEGELLRKALVELAQRGERFESAWSAWLDYSYYADLQARLQNPSATPSDADERLLHRLRELGVEHQDDLELLDPADLAPPALDPEWTSLYPKQYRYGGVAYDVEYRPGLVTLIWRSGPRGARPPAPHLPKWNGWKVEVEERGRRSPLR